MKWILFIVLFFPTGLWAKPSLVFDGYYKILAGNQHVGYIIHRYIFDDKTKRFQSIHYLRTNKVAGNQTESLVAFADDRFHPISFQFTQTVGSKVKIIDATFKNLAMTASLSNGQKSQNISQSFKKGTFLSIFLTPLMMSQGVSNDKRYTYAAIAEEDGKSYKGDAYIQKNMVSYKGQSVFKVMNVFKGNKFYFFLNSKGEYLGSHSPSQNISTELVANPFEATRNMPVNGAHLKKIFGEVPKGQKNTLAEATTSLAPSPNQNSVQKIQPQPESPNSKKKGP